MRALILDGCEAVAGLTPPDEIVLSAMAERGWRADTLHLRDMEIAPCMGCFGCWLRTPGVCVTDDAAREVAKAYVGSDVVALLTPIRFGGYGYHLKKAIDRLIPVLSPLFTVLQGEVHHRKRYRHYPAILAVGVSSGRDPEGEDTFRRLVERNAINKRAPRYAAVTIETSWSGSQSRDALREALGALEGGPR